MSRKSIDELIEEDKLDENLQMIRRIREELHRQYHTLEALCAHLDAAERASRHVAKSRAARPKRRKAGTAKVSPSVAAS